MAISRNDRAKQFLAFDALKGLREALEEKERKIEEVERKELSDEVKEQIAKQLNMLKVHDYIEVKYYNKGKYDNIKGNISKIDFANNSIIFYNNKEIKFIDIYSINM